MTVKLLLYCRDISMGKPAATAASAAAAAAADAADAEAAAPAAAAAMTQPRPTTAELPPVSFLTVCNFFLTRGGQVAPPTEETPVPAWLDLAESEEMCECVGVPTCTSTLASSTCEAVQYLQLLPVEE
jgi:hypothetical protein